jgi:glycosyltransferase involved in cell wall biosynthesis
MRILFVTPYVPSPVRIRPYAFIRDLARRGHEITLVCLVQPPTERRYVADVSRYCRAIYPVGLKRGEALREALRSLPGPLPLSVAYCRSTAMRVQVRELLKSGNFDLLHTEFVRATTSTSDLTGLPKVYDAVDSVALASERALQAPGVPLRRRLVAWLEWVKMRDYERAVLDDYDNVLVSSPVDAAVLEGREARIGGAPSAEQTASEGSGRPPIRVVPNGVDGDEFAFSDGEREPATLVFLGRMSYYVNVASLLWFYQEVFPLIRRRYPQVYLKIVGRDPVRRIADLASDPSVEVTGTVSDVRPHLGSATVSIAPMVTGSGIQNKLLEAMAVGAPSVATPIACQALEVEPDRELLIAKEADDFAAAVVRLLQDADLRRRVAHAARGYVERRHDWWVIGRRLERIYEELVAGRESRI